MIVAGVLLVVGLIVFFSSPLVALQALAPEAPYAGFLVGPVLSVTGFAVFVVLFAQWILVGRKKGK